MVIPDETTYCIDSLPRWQREWLKKHRAINRSGYIQKCISILIEEKDPEYYAKYKKYAENVIRRNDTTPMPEKLLRMKQ